MFYQPLSTCEPNHYDSYTYSCQKHEPSGFCLYLNGLDGINKLFNPIIYTKHSSYKKDLQRLVQETKTTKTYKTRTRGI